MGRLTFVKEGSHFLILSHSYQFKLNIHNQITSMELKKECRKSSGTLIVCLTIILW
ncbi:hypothetical protein SRABI134_00669 [Peribacillus sp. Bi134]|nr:hypothetical protein SRABI134_00669 [Peribacillus sp. Bi134]